MVFYFDITEEKINTMPTEFYEALERAQDGDVKLYRLRPALCHFLVDERGKPYEQKQAEKMTSKLTMQEVKSFLEQFFTSVETKAIPKGTGSPSLLPSEVKVADSVSLSG